MQNHLQQGDQALAVGVQKTEIAGAPETLRQHMLQHQPQELRAGDGAPLPFPRLGVAIPESHLAVFTGDDIRLPDDTPVKITPQVDQRRLSAADRFAIHHPFPRMASGQRQAGGLDARQHLRPEDLGQRLMVEQIAPLAFALSFPYSPRLASPLPVCGVDRRRRHDEMDVGMEIQFARMGVQYRDGARRTPQLPIVLAERAQRLPSATQEQIVDRLLVGKGQRAEFGGHGEGDQKVFRRHQPFHLPFQPLLAFVMLAVRAVAMAARMGDQYLMLTRRAADLHLGAGVGTAVFHRRECPEVFRGQSIPVLRAEISLEGVDDGSEPDHLAGSQTERKPSIKPLMRSMA